MRQLAIALIFSFTIGCGYTLVGSGLGGVDAVAIRTPLNDSSEPGAEYLVADALRRELLRRAGTRLTEDAGRADLVVSGRIVSIESRARSFSSAILAREHELVVEIELLAARRDGSEISAPRAAFRETERYLASADIEVQRKNREEALRRVSSLLAGRFFDSVSEALTP